jgi:cytochrome c-type biogenesis protein CcmF
VSQRLFGAFGAALAIALLAFVLVDRASVLAALGIGLGVWLVLGAMTDLVVKSGVGKAAPSVVFSRFKGLPRSVFGTALAHAGIGLTTIGIISVTTLETERIAAMQPGETVQIQGYNLRFDSLRPFTGPNYTEDQATFVLSRVTGKPLGEVVSSKRLYTARQMPTTEAGIRTLGLSQLYVSLGDQTPNGKIVVRIWWKPMVTLIWLGALVMMVGGTVSLLDRRLRVGAPMPRRKPAVEGRVA